MNDAKNEVPEQVQAAVDATSDSAEEQQPPTSTGPTAGAEETQPTPTFADLGLSPEVLQAITEVGYETPSAIQAATIPTLLEGRDVVGLAQTGTGKTAAFALPILSRIEPGLGTPQALVLAPTRELALQVCEAFESYATHLPEVHLLPVYGGSSYGQQLHALRRGVDIVVGTPGRVMDHMERGSLDLSQVKYLVLDEADEMLKMGFAEDVEEILAQTPEEKQVALFSATMPAQIRRISQQHLSDPVEVKIKGKTETGQNISQHYVVVSFTQKLDALTRILEVTEVDGLIVFTRTRGDTEVVAEKLRARGYSAAAINGDIPQAQRERTVQALKDGRLDILVATDVAARGLDVERISHVVNYDLPIDTESYVHRIGRTGRAGRSGVSISFVTPRERRLLKTIEKATKQPLAQMQLPYVSEVNASRLARFDDAITQALEETERIAAFRDIISHYMRHHDVPEGDVAAALAVVAQGDTPLLLDEDEDDKFARDREHAERFLQDGVRGERGGRGGGAGDGAARRGAGAAGRGGREPWRAADEARGPLASYRLEVGRRARINPGMIVGALANEGGLLREDFGHIKIFEDFTLVELPENLPEEVLEQLQHTKVGGRSIRISRDRGPGGRGGKRERGFERDHERGDRERGGKRERWERGDRDRERGYERDRGHDRGYDRGDRDFRSGGKGEKRGKKHRDDFSGRKGKRADRFADDFDFSADSFRSRDFGAGRADGKKKPRKKK